MRKDKVPLLTGIVNFYPAFAYGVRVCGLCALAVRFLPMTILRTGVYKRLWFLHTHDESVAIRIAKQYGWLHFNMLIAKNEYLYFFSNWETAGDAGTVLYLLCELLENFFDEDEVRQLYESPSPMTAYVFSNDLRDTYINAIPIPNELFTFFFCSPERIVRERIAQECFQSFLARTFTSRVARERVEKLHQFCPIGFLPIAEYGKHFGHLS